MNLTQRERIKKTQIRWEGQHGNSLSSTKSVRELKAQITRM